MLLTDSELAAFHDLAGANTLPRTAAGNLLAFLRALGASGASKPPSFRHLPEHLRQHAEHAFDCGRANRRRRES